MKKTTSSLTLLLLGLLLFSKGANAFFCFNFSFGGGGTNRSAFNRPPPPPMWSPVYPTTPLPYPQWLPGYPQSTAKAKSSSKKERQK